jgi:DNA-binding ferritin-like protein
MESAFIDVLTKLNNVVGSARLCHWNVEGVDFYQFHLVFERIYEMAEAKVDGLAEQARGKDIEIPAKMFNDVPELDWSTPAELAGELYKVVEEYCKSLHELHEKADDKAEYGILNIVEDMMTDASTMKYLLGSVNKKYDNPPEDDKEKEEED